MKYVALLSGGKDSCYNLLHCARNGHQLAAAASLGPGQGKEEIDSYLYQTVGQDAIELVARALDVPLYRRVISGMALEQGSEYGHRDPSRGVGVIGDETEDLHALLSLVKDRHPDVEGVSVGAILSNYQRVRVEHVCRRLALTPLCYLWQRDQSELLAEMIEAGMEAILIKVAGIGLTVKHLGKNLAEMQQTLLKLNDLYGSHICGEGGEYETLTLDCPLFKQRISIQDTETVVHTDGDFAVVAYLRIKDAVLKSKSSCEIPNPAIPHILPKSYQELSAVVAEQVSTTADVPNSSYLSSLHGAEPLPLIRSQQVGSFVTVANVSRTGESDMTIEEEVQACFQQLEGIRFVSSYLGNYNKFADILHHYSLKLSHCTNINVFLSSMDLFSRVNAVYATYFGTSPPARACVAVDLPPPVRIRLDCISFVEKTPTDRQALHVQSLSYWAPANIGPYSQAIIVDERVFISGQIGLIPSNLLLPSPPSLALETALSFKHVESVVDMLRSNSGGGWTGHTQNATYWLVNETDTPRIKAASSSYAKDAHAAILFLTVSALPKGALVEKQVLLHTGQCSLEDEDGEMVLQHLVPEFQQGSLLGAEGTSVYWEVSSINKSNAVAVIAFRHDTPENVASLKKIPELHRVWENPVSVRLFYRRSVASTCRFSLR
ncbi:uncharacterized protein FIBRA_01467 [Fibroporia radiculosa]|uniref:Diphthine--ammonia ligase n=1 Tax=Fibroporia radiculosa TaxID=599839 RepID=J4H152_9APHY|nr:uncharacterized protein FIBRA_01467 [Fibroporia radiculosa]CCL99449.1 predicted protein [Fibroporia radiculosa]